MALYVYDLGFDWNAAQRPGSDLYYLNYGFVSFGSTTTDQNGGIQIGDVIGFNGFNQTSGAGLTQYSILGGEVTFNRENKSQAVLSPFNASTFNISALGQATQTLVSDALSPNNAIPYWQSLIVPQPIVNDGRFLFSISLRVQGPGGSIKTFFVDPEMVVGSVE